jgi:hypothetical protein
MEKARNDELYRALKEKDYPDDFCREIAYNQIRTDYTELVCWGIFTEHQIRERKMWWMRCWQFSVIEMPSCRKRSWNMLRQQSIRFTETDYKERRT